MNGLSPDLLEYDESNDDDCEDDDEDCELYAFYPNFKDDLEIDEEYTRNPNINIGQQRVDINSSWNAKGQLEQTTVYGCRNSRIYALRDIQAGEGNHFQHIVLGLRTSLLDYHSQIELYCISCTRLELLMSYGDFSEPRGFRAIGLYHFDW